MARWFLFAVALALPIVVAAAPDEDRLGRSRGYPVAKRGNNKDWYYDESVRVGSFTHQAEIPGLWGGKPNELSPAAEPLPLPVAAHEPDYRWQIGKERALTVGDFLARQRIMGLLIVKDGVVQVERYQYGRTAADRFTSNSIAKSITALAVGFALAEGSIGSIDDQAARYAPKLAGTVLGTTTIRNLLRMASGARYEQAHGAVRGDTTAFSQAMLRDGIEAAVHTVKGREREQGTRFVYMSPHAVVLAAVVRGATGMNLSTYLTPRLWQALGAEHSAFWLSEKTGLEVALGNFNATLRDYGRLGVVLANDGMRPDTHKQVLPRAYLREATDWTLAEPAFRPARATPTLGYGYQFWTFPGPGRRFALLGAFGQSIFVDPSQHLVIVQTAANATEDAGDTSLARERTAFWRGVMGYYGGR